jgi:hypothetical protein
LRSGETVEGSFESARKGIEDTKNRTLLGLHLQERKIQSEFKLVYGKNADPSLKQPDKTYPELPPRG